MTCVTLGAGAQPCVAKVSNRNGARSQLGMVWIQAADLGQISALQQFCDLGPF